MAIAYSGSTIIDTTFTSTGTKLDLVNNLDTQLAAAGWTAISGAGGTNPVYVSATTPQGIKIRVDFDSTGATNCMRLRLSGLDIANAAINSSYLFLLPSNGNLFRIWANKYQFFMFRSGTDTSLQRSFLCGGVPWTTVAMVDFLQNDIGSNIYVGWIHGNGATDTSTTTQQNTFRKIVTTSAITSWRVIWGDTAFGSDVNTTQFYLLSEGSVSDYNYRWENGDYHMYPPILVWPTGISTNTTSTRHGMLWDAVALGRAFNSEVLREFEGLTWRNITHQQTTVPVASLFLLTNG